MSVPHSRPPAELQTLVAPNASPYTLDGTNSYLLGGPEVVVVDPGPDDAGHVSRILTHAAARRGRVALILVTHGHEDHQGAARSLAEASGAPVGRWRGGDRPLDDGEVVGESPVRLRVLHTPGHTPDHIALLWEERRTLFSGDLVLGRGTVTVSPPEGSMDDYLRSLARVASLDLAAIAPGHGPMIEDPAPRVAEYLAHRRLRERQVLEAVAAGPRTPGEISALLYPDLDPRLHPAAEGTVLAHLLKLLGEGRVERAGNRYYTP
ncbi:MAG TPA: MBL fold metallo-hydrolase [Acidimicrobiales bacterium]|nr:MBL fold metallo-hydrolase [Acidimicrobiales bacterium]